MTATGDESKTPSDVDEAHWLRLKDIFYRAIELPAKQRLDFVARETVGDPILRDEVLALVAQDLSNSNPFETLARITVRRATAAHAIVTPAPVGRLDSLTRWLLFEAEHRRYVAPFIADVEYEYLVALLCNKPWKARWIIARGYWHVSKPFFRALLDTIVRLLNLMRQ